MGRQEDKDVLEARKTVAAAERARKRLMPEIGDRARLQRLAASGVSAGETLKRAKRARRRARRHTS